MNYEEKENWEMVAYRMHAEGFHYCFVNYSSFSEIKDEKFHQLREAYLQVATKLENYVKVKLDEEVKEENL